MTSGADNRRSPRRIVAHRHQRPAHGTQQIAVHHTENRSGYESRDGQPSRENREEAQVQPGLNQSQPGVDTQCA
jgi:hypothetical protein